MRPLLTTDTEPARKVFRELRIDDLLLCDVDAIEHTQ